MDASRRLGPRTLIGVVVVVAIAGGAAILLAGGGSAEPITSPTIDPALAARLMDQDITLRPPSRQDVPVQASTAAETAANSLTSISSGAKPTATLVNFTDAQRGKEKEDGSIDPSYANREAWAVVFSDVEVPLFGPPVPKASDAEGDSTRQPDGSTATQTLVVFIDATSGEFLEAIAL